MSGAGKLTPEVLARLRELEKAAFRPPWRAETWTVDCREEDCGDEDCPGEADAETVLAPEEYPADPDSPQVVAHVDGAVTIHTPGLEGFARAHSEFIAAARNALPDLLDALEEARRERDALHVAFQGLVGDMELARREVATLAADCDERTALNLRYLRELEEARRDLAHMRDSSGDDSCAGYAAERDRLAEEARLHHLELEIIGSTAINAEQERDAARAEVAALRANVTKALGNHVTDCGRVLCNDPICRVVRALSGEGSGT